MPKRDALLSVQGLRVVFPVRSSQFRKQELVAVDEMSFDVEHGSTLGIVGESGSGKSTIARAIVGIERVASGDILFGGRSLMTLSKSEWRKTRRRIQMVFQDPAGSLNPRKTILETLDEPLRLYREIDARERKAEVSRLLEQVGLPQRVLGAYPRMLSGGQQQRAAIARALTVGPQLLICDEPVSALDVSIQAQIINLLADLQRDLGISIIFIAHDLGVVRQVSPRVLVMYLGRAVEYGSRTEVFESPKHPYTQALLASMPTLDVDEPRQQRVLHVAGEIPSPLNPPSGCSFRTRCPYARQRCAEQVPALRRAGSTQSAACHFFEELPTPLLEGK